MASFRLGVVDLRGNKTGEGKTEEERRCRFCGKKLETEFHLMMECEEKEIKGVREEVKRAVDKVEGGVQWREDWGVGWGEGRKRREVKVMGWLLGGGGREERKLAVWDKVVKFLLEIVRVVEKEGGRVIGEEVAPVLIDEAVG